MSCFCIVCTREANRGILQTLGKYAGITRPGLACIGWPFTTVTGVVSMRVQMVDVSVETKTKDNVFVHVVVSVQYKVIESEIEQAFYRLTDPKQQIRSYVFDSVRSIVPGMELDRVFESKEEVAHGVKQQLSSQMLEFGYEIVQTLVIDVAPDTRVKVSMNEISANRRMKEAAQFKADAEKITLVKAAEADAERKHLNGTGVAKQRRAIVGGLRDSVKDFQAGVNGTTAADVLSLVMVSQYFDTLSAIGSQPGTRLIYTEESNGVRDGILSAQSAAR